MTLAERKRVAAQILHRSGFFPSPEARCLEVCVGKLGWLPDLLSWGVPEVNLAAIDSDESRVAAARRLMPCADIRLGNAAELPWQSRSFQLVVCSVAFTSILNEQVRTAAAGEIRRVLGPDGAVLWYDFTFDNPRNPNVRGISRSQLQSYFPDLYLQSRRVTLAPPIARAVAPWSCTLATALAAVPFLRTHILAVAAHSNFRQ